MKILVLMKEVPDMTKVEFDRERGAVNRADAPSEINPFDLNAIAAAVELKKSVMGSTVTVLTMGPPSAVKSLREAYARGADRVCLLSDRKFSGADTLATSNTLASAIKQLDQFQLIICGEKSVDGDTAQVGPEVAELLNIPHASYVETLKEITDKAVAVECGDICGNRQIKSMWLPALINVTKNINKPKLPTVDRKLESLDIEVTQYTYEDLKKMISEEEVGSKGSPTRVKKVVVQEKPERRGQIFRNDPQGFLEAFAERREALGIENV